MNLVLPLFRRVVMCCALAMCGANAVVSAQQTSLAIGGARVEDVALWDGEFSRWNFGGSPLLEVGRTMGIYAEHNSVSLLRFNLQGVQADSITGARLLVYKPRSFTQLQPVSIEVSEVSTRGRSWTQGAGFGEVVPTGATWDAIDGKQAWPGAPGASLIGMDQHIPALDAQTARDDEGHWVAFNLPPALVARWIANPESNTGLRLALAPGREARWGDHVHLYSSEHFSGKGPRLELTGAGLRQNNQAIAAGNPAFRLPEKDAAFRRWKKSRSRMAGFTRDLALRDDETLLFYFFDTEVRAKLVFARYRGPITQVLSRLGQAIKARDATATHACLGELREKLLVWEVIREALWYTAGPLAGHLTSDQLAKLYTQSMWGKMEEKMNTGIRQRATSRGEDPESARGAWDPVSAEALPERQQAALQRVIDNTRPTAQQVTELTPGLYEFVRLENTHLATFVRYLREVRRHADGEAIPEVWDSFRLMNHHHEAFLYYQSLFNTPRWHYLGEKTPLFGWARWISAVGARYALSEKQMSDYDLDDTQ